MQRERKHHSKWRKFIRHNRELVFIGFVTVLVLAAVAFLFWAMSSSHFLKPRE